MDKLQFFNPISDVGCRGRGGGICLITPVTDFWSHILLFKKFEKFKCEEEDSLKRVTMFAFEFVFLQVVVSRMKKFDDTGKFRFFYKFTLHIFESLHNLSSTWLFFYLLKEICFNNCQKMDNCLQSKIIVLFLTTNALSMPLLHYLPFKSTSRLGFANAGLHILPTRYIRSLYSLLSLLRIVKR